MSERVVSFDLKNERVVLSTIIRDSSARRRVAREVDSAEFGEPKNQVIFRALAQMAKANLEWSEDTLADLAGDEDFGGFAYVRAIVEDYEPNRNLDFHLERLRLDASKYALMGTDLPAIAELAQRSSASADDIGRTLRAAAGRFDNLGRRFVERGPQLRKAYYEEMRLRVAVGDVVEGTGFPLLDKGLLRGFIPGISGLVGRPSHGKTTWLSNFLRRRIAAEKRTYLGAWEMGKIDYLDMMVSAETGILADDLAKKARLFATEEKRSINEALERFTADDLLAIERNPFPHLPKISKRWEANERNLGYIATIVEQECDRYPLFVFDVITKALPDRRPEAINDALVFLREEVAIRNGVHLMLVSHLNRDAAQSRPTLENIKGSGAWEEECDLILAADRPILRASPGRRRKMQDVLDIHVLKQRKGPAPYCTRYRFDGPHYALTSEIEVDVSMLEKDDEEDL